MHVQRARLTVGVLDEPRLASSLQNVSVLNINVVSAPDLLQYLYGQRTQATRT